MEVSGKAQWTNESLQVAQHQTEEGSLPAGTSMEEMPAWEEDGRKRCLKCRVESDVDVISAVHSAGLSSAVEFRM